MATKPDYQRAYGSDLSPPEHQYDHGSGSYSPHEAESGAGPGGDPSTSRPATPLDCLTYEQHSEHEPYPQAMRASDRTEFLLYSRIDQDNLHVIEEPHYLQLQGVTASPGEGSSDSSAGRGGGGGSGGGGSPRRSSGGYTHLAALQPTNDERDTYADMDQPALTALGVNYGVDAGSSSPPQGNITG